MRHVLEAWKLMQSPSSCHLLPLGDKLYINIYESSEIIFTAKYYTKSPL